MEPPLDSSLFSSLRKRIKNARKSSTFTKSSYEPKAKRSSDGLEQEMHNEASGLRSRSRKERVFHQDMDKDNNISQPLISPLNDFKGGVSNENSSQTWNATTPCCPKSLDQVSHKKK